MENMSDIRKDFEEALKAAEASIKDMHWDVVLPRAIIEAYEQAKDDKELVAEGIYSKYSHKLTYAECEDIASMGGAVDECIHVTRKHFGKE